MEENLSLDLKARVQCSALQKGEGIEGSSGGGGGGCRKLRREPWGAHGVGKRALTGLSPSASDIFPLPAPCPSLIQAAYCLGSRDSAEPSAAIQGMWLPVTHLASQASEDELSAYLQSDPGMARLQQQQTVGGLSSGGAWSPDPAVSARRPVTGPQTWGCSRGRCRS